jgi:Inner membrane protein YgaP-like, transmembrane domain
MLTLNESLLDRAIRIVLGLILVIAAVSGSIGVWTWAAGMVGFILLATGAVGFCPLYRLFDVNTRQL